MKTDTKSQGFTILEALVVIAIMGFLMATAMTVMSGRQTQIQFEQAARDYDAAIRSTINDVSTGFFPDVPFNCQLVAGGQVSVSVGSEGQGTRSDCVFLGKFIEVWDSGSNEFFDDGFNITSMVGNRRATSLEQSGLIAVATNDIDITERYTNRWGMEIERVAVYDGSEATDVRYFGFLTSLSPLSEGDGLRPVSGNTVVNTFYSTNHSVRDIDVASADTRPSPLSSSEAIYICASMPDSNRKAVFTIGADGGPLTTAIDQDPGDNYTSQCGTGF